MGVLSVLISIVFLLYLILRITGMLGRSTTTFALNEPSEGPAELPKRSDAEVNALVASMPTAWVVYGGTTPPLNLKIRGLTNELHRRFARVVLDAYGRDALNGLSQLETRKVVESLLPTINAQAYVVEWNGARYPNGNPLPATVDNLASLMRKDEMLLNFISNEAAKLGPSW